MKSMEDRHRLAVGQRIVQLREVAELSQPALAELAGIKQSSLWAIENGETKEVTARTLIGLCRALNTTWEHLWDGSEAEPQQAAEEAELIAIYRHATPEARIAILHHARGVKAGAPGTDDSRAVSSAEDKRFVELKRRAPKRPKPPTGGGGLLKR